VHAIQQPARAAAGEGGRACTGPTPRNRPAAGPSGCLSAGNAGQASERVRRGDGAHNLRCRQPASNDGTLQQPRPGTGRGGGQARGRGISRGGSVSKCRGMGTSTLTPPSPEQAGSQPTVKRHLGRQVPRNPAHCGRRSRGSGTSIPGPGQPAPPAGQAAGSDKPWRPMFGFMFSKAAASVMEVCLMERRHGHSKHAAVGRNDE
jgi:hypothetical protein